jgi:hypothetical protein
VKQKLLTGSVSFFGKQWEILTEGTFAFNKTDSTGTKRTLASYLYTGIRLNEKFVPYIRLDYLDYEEGELFFMSNDTRSLVAGIRYQFNYLAVLKLEFQHTDYDQSADLDKVTAQLAIGF